MAVTPTFAFPYLGYTDAPDLAAGTRGLAEQIELILNTKFAQKGSIRLDYSGTPVVIGTAGLKLTSWAGPAFNTSDMTYGSGVVTIHSNGIYIPATTIQWPAATVGYRVSQGFVINGGSTFVEAGQHEAQFSNGVGSQHLTCGGIAFQLAAGNTIQVRLEGSTNGIAGIQPTAFSVTRVG
jgi:urocanate hydratase